MIVVSNTSPIINLTSIGQLDLLHQLYGKIIIPQAVYHEIAILGTGKAGAAEVRVSSWIERREVIAHPLAMSLQMELDQGESETIALAIESKADLLLMDERRGRTIASNLGLKSIGLLGVLMEAKYRGFIPAVKPIVDDLIVKAGFWVSKELYASILRAARE